VAAACCWYVLYLLVEYVDFYVRGLLLAVYHHGGG
jgi:hypothetical protein